MKNKLVLFWLAIVTTTNLYSQDCFLYVSTQNERLKPSTKSVGIPQNEILAQIFKEFEVTSYYQSFPGAKTPELQHFYEIHFKGDADKLEKTLTERKIFDEIYRCDHYEPISCNNPVIVNDPYPDSYWPITQVNYALTLLDAECAWTITKGSSDIVVAVVDTEFKTDHEDLINTFVGTVGSRTDPRDHGTSVSSCLAVGTNNDKGIAAIGYNTKIKGYYVDSGTVWNGVWAAYQDGIKIINVSWTGIGAYPNILMVQEMIDNGVILVTAAGNDTVAHALSHKNYATIPGVINVSGVDAGDNHGNTGHVHNAWVDVCALSKEVIACSIFNNFGAYTVSGGTSLAAPQVAGVVALMRSINNDITPAEIENIIKSTADPIADANQYPGLIGTGRVNAYKALLATLDLCPSITLTGQNPELPETYQRTVCREINIRNITVPANTILEVKATQGQTTINDFIVEEGAVFVVE